MSVDLSRQVNRREYRTRKEKIKGLRSEGKKATIMTNNECLKKTEEDSWNESMQCVKGNEQRR